MVVDDYSLNRDLLMRQLERLGIQAEPFENGRDALLAWSPGTFDIVFTDCHMPLLDGYALARAIRRREADLSLARMPVIGWTVNLFASEVQRCRAAGMNDVLQKPSTSEDLRKVLVRWMMPFPESGSAGPMVGAPDG